MAEPVTVSTGAEVPSAPAVSVIMPAYNTAALIGEALDSVLAQTYTHFETIVINDGSPDTAQLEEALRPYRSRIVYIVQENRRAAGARNTGIRNARGKYLAFLDSDDIWLPEYLAAQVKFLEARPHLVASIADWVKFGMPGGDVVRRMLRNHATSSLTFEQMLRRKAQQLPSATVARRVRVIEAGMYDERLRIGEDVEFFLRICFPDGAVGYVGQVLVKYRQRPGSLTCDPGNRKWRVAEGQALRALREKLPLTGAQRTLLDNEIAACDAAVALSDGFDHLSAGRYEQGERCFAEANTHFRDPRITLTRFGLKAFPRWTARVVKWRRKRAADRSSTGK